MLTDEEHRRYSRHILLDSVGKAGQIKLKNSRVLVIGAGGLGCPVLQYLTAAGIGTIGIIDFDHVDESNLQRQILFTINDIGKNKAQAAKDRLTLLNPLVNFIVYKDKLTPINAIELFHQFDLIVDGTDNFSTRYLVNDASVITNTPLVYGAIYKFEGQVSVFNYENGPSYRCLFPDPPAPGSVPNCSEIGVLGVLPGLIGSQQANEALKILLNIGTPLSGKLLLYNSLNNHTAIINIDRQEEQVQKALDLEPNFKQLDYDVFCGLKKEELPEINFQELLALNSKEKIQIVDVREIWEQPRIDYLRPLVAPLNELEKHLNDISKEKKVVFCCQKGIRSLSAIQLLSDKYNYQNLINLKSGLTAYNIEEYG